MKTKAVKTRHFEFVVIGGGSAGYAAARKAREKCASVAIIDGAPHLGGLCILRGCMPSKTLIYTAEVLHLAQRGREFGLKIPEAHADMDAIHRRKLEVNPLFPALRSAPTAVSGAAREKQIPSSDMPHVWANTICVTGALLFYNLMATMSGQLGKGELVRALLSPPRKLPNPAAKP